jgi:cytochrome c-type biogenesis protein CcmH
VTTLMLARLLAIAALALVIAAPALGAGRDLNARELQLESRVMCPTCHQLLVLSHSPVAERMRHFIRGRLAAGESGAAIERELVDQFGPAVLASPPARGFGLLAWLIPAGGVAAAAAVVLAFARAWRRRSPVADDSAELSTELLRRLERELAAFDR